MICLIKKITGIIIKETPYSETSKILNVLTSDGHVIGIMAKGARSMKSKIRSCTSLFTYGVFDVYYKENKLSTLISVDIINDLANIKQDIVLISYLNYLTELTAQVLKQMESKEIYDLFISSILKINEGLNPLVIANILEIKCLDFLGVTLNLEGCVKCGNTSNIVTIDGDAGGYICSNCYTNELLVSSKTIKMLRMYYYVDIKSISKLDIKEEVIQEINFFLDKYYERYTGLYLNSKNFLKNVTNL